MEKGIASSVCFFSPLLNICLMPYTRMPMALKCPQKTHDLDNVPTIQ